MQIKEDAIFIADAHYNFKRKDLENLLKQINEGVLNCSQLFLMGDIFDFVVGEVCYFKKVNGKVLELINNISKKIEVFYFEGNHDYNLKKLFPNVKVFSREEQAIKMTLDNKSVELSHGDIFVGKAYDLFCKIIRNRFLLMFLNNLDIFSWLSKKIEAKLANKNICHEIENFETLANKRIKNYSADIVIEGHYHQGKKYIFDKQTYINIPSLACVQKYMRYKDKEFIWQDV